MRSRKGNEGARGVQGSGLGPKSPATHPHGSPSQREPPATRREDPAPAQRSGRFVWKRDPQNGVEWELE